MSLVKARQSGLWHRHADGSERERTAPAAQPVYDPVAIGAEVMTLDRADQAWREWFAQEQIDPLKITYEALAQKPVETVRDICSMLGIDTVNAAMMRPTIAKLADDINLEWTARYRAGVPPM